jgi:RNA polymerase sigma-70 factor (ECF subfamily)
LSGSRDAADDLVQETLVRALLHFDRYRQGSNALAWLVTILTRLWFDNLKHVRVASRVSSILEATDTSLVEDIPFTNISEETLGMAIARLHPDLRIVVELVYVRGMSSREAAKRLNITPSTLWFRRKKALGQLREFIEGRDR